MIITTADDVDVAREGILVLSEYFLARLTEVIHFSLLQNIAIQLLSHLLDI